MGNLMKDWVKGILTENIEKKVVVYSGRFQPFHKGHYATYMNLVEHFGKANVYIASSNKTDNIKSPFTFKEKKTIMMKMFGIASNKIVQIKNPYAPSEIIDKFPEDTTALISVVGEKDRYRLKGKYYEPYHPDKVQQGYKEKGYVYVAPAQSNAISGTDVRNWLAKGTEGQRKSGFKKAYGKFDPKIFKLVSSRLFKVESTMEAFLKTFDITELLKEAGVYGADAGEPDTGYLPAGQKRKLGTNSGKPEPWFDRGGYVQLHFPEADSVYEPNSEDASFSVAKSSKPKEGLKEPIETDDYVTAGVGKKGKSLKDINEASNSTATAIGGNSQGVDDGPGAFYGNFKSYKSISDATATALGWQVVDYIMDTEDSIFADEARTLADKHPVSFFPSGVAGLDAQSQRYDDFKGNAAYKKWKSHITKIATTVGYTLVDFLDADDSIESSKNEPRKVETPNITRDTETEKLKENLIVEAGKKPPGEFYRYDARDKNGAYGKYFYHNNKIAGASALDMVKYGEVPISAPLVNKMTGGIRKTTLHATDIEGYKKLLKLQGTKKSISTFSKVTGDSELHTGGGVLTGGGILVAVNGQVLLDDYGDAFTYPDKSGRRWGGTMKFVGIGGKDWYNMVSGNKTLDALLQKSYDYDYRNSNKPLSSGEKNKLVTGYIDFFYKMVGKNKAKALAAMKDNSEFVDKFEGHNEIVLNDIKIVDAVILKTYDMTDDDVADIKKQLPTVKFVDGKSDMTAFVKKHGAKVFEWVTNTTPNSELIKEGGAYGHMNHPFDIEMNLTFGDLKQIIRGALNGKLELAREKTDGQALAVSWRDDKGLIAARNKGHLKNKGQNALDISAMASKFSGRGGLTDAYNFAMRDLSNAISALSSPQRDKIFQQGAVFVNLEVIWPSSVNVVPYGQALLVFHNAAEFDEDGVQIGANDSAARILAGMIKQINKDVTDKYTIQGPPVTKLPKSQELSNMQSRFDSQLKKVQSEFKLKDSDGVADYHQAWWENWVDKNSPATLDNKTKMGLVKRWAFFDKGFGLNKKNILDAPTLEWAKKIDKKDQKTMAKTNTRKFEDIFLGVGAEVLSFMSSVLTVNPDQAVRDMKKRLDQTIKDVSKSGSPEKIAKLKMELERLAAIGGKDKIVPNEGIVFVFKGDTFKLTGSFASLNQILGLMYF